MLGWRGLGETVLETSKEGCREEGGKGLVVKQDGGLLSEIDHRCCRGSGGALSKVRHSLGVRREDNGGFGLLRLPRMLGLRRGASSVRTWCSRLGGAGVMVHGGERWLVNW